MSWQDVLGHDALVEQFRLALERRRLASTFLFVGPPGVGKRTFAMKLAKALLCEASSEERLDPCGRCAACVQVDAGSHPDLQLISKPPDKNFIPVDVFIGDRQHRMQRGLCREIAMKPFRGGRKIAIIDDADSMNQEGANCLLKTLEEPPPRSVLILIATSQHRQLPTIRSRCQIVRFRPLSDDVVAELLISRGLIGDEAEARRLAGLCQGSLVRAMDLADPALWEFCGQLVDGLGDPDLDSTAFAGELSRFVEEAGKDAPARRERMRKVVGLAIQFYRRLLRGMSGAADEGDDPVGRGVLSAQQSWPGDEQAVVACLDRCLDALSHIDANANQATLLECWLDDLATITRTGRPVLV